MSDNQPVLLVGNQQTMMFRMYTIKSALSLEVMGMKHSRGSVYAMVKRDFNLKGTKKKVYEQFCDIIKKIERGELEVVEVQS